MSSIAAILLILSTLAASTGAWAASESENPKNILLIISDDLNTDFGVYGHEVVQTPNLDRFAENALVFDRAYCQFPVCNPSRASFLSGLRPWTTGIIDNHTAFVEKHPDIVTLPRFFRESGYFTGATGKIFHNAKTDDPKAWDEVMKADLDVHAQPGEGRAVSDELYFLEWKALDGGDNAFFDGLIADNAARLIQTAASSKKPFFIAVGFIRPHDPFYAPKEDFDLYPLESLELPPNENVEGLSEMAWPIGKWKAVYDQFTLQDKRELMRSYYAGVTYMDRQFGKVMKALEASGQADDTLVVIIGDHGYHLWEKEWFTKATQFERSALTPLIIRDPSGVNGRTNAIVEFVDFYPTLVDYAGLDAPEHLEGESFAQVLKDVTAEHKSAAFTELGPYARSVRTDNWRYIEWYRKGRQGDTDGRALYDHRLDPHESRNLADLPEYAEKRKEMKQLLDSNWE